MIFGKIIGGLLGLLAGNVIGLVIGVLVGHAFDRGLFKAMRFASPQNIKRIRDCFFDTTFLLAGYLAKVDGQVSEAEIAHAEQLFQQLNLDTEQRRRAIQQFKQGSGANYKIEPTISAFLETCGPQAQLIQTLLLFLISQAHADEEVTSAETAALFRIAQLFGLSAVQLERLLNMAKAQQRFHNSGSGAQSSGTSIESAYAALGVESSIGDKELKRAYRKLMSEHHPDKLIAKGLPEAMIRVATERSQEIQAAYEMARKHRGLSRK